LAGETRSHGTERVLPAEERETIQEAISLTVFTLITVFIFKTEKLAWNHLVGFLLIVLAVFVIFKKW
jgi:uncharacterized protein